jgi:hypothetical protein
MPAVRGDGAAPILVIGTTHDPSTPYAMSQALAAALEPAVLLTRDGDGHTAFGRGYGCIDDPVVRYLVDLEVPPDGVVCRGG